MNDFSRWGLQTGEPSWQSTHIAIATAVNVLQVISWLRGEVPGQTRISPFKRPMQQAV